jgi:hypothetical protein
LPNLVKGTPAQGHNGRRPGCPRPRGARGPGVPEAPGCPRPGCPRPGCPRPVSRQGCPGVETGVPSVRNGVPEANAHSCGAPGRNAPSIGARRSHRLASAGDVRSNDKPTNEQLAHENSGVGTTTGSRAGGARTPAAQHDATTSNAKRDEFSPCHSRILRPTDPAPSGRASKPDVRQQMHLDLRHPLRLRVHPRRPQPQPLPLRQSHLAPRS